VNLKTECKRHERPMRTIGRRQSRMNDMYVRSITYVGGVIYGIYGVRSWEIRQDFNNLLIGDKQSSPTTRRRARRSAHLTRHLW
jgi:hypothetical protein